MAKPTVFFSHSCKDHEQTPPAGFSAAEVVVRTERLAFARTLRTRLVEAIAADGRLQPFLDVLGGLKAGDIWQDGLHGALRTCAAGVVLLTPESLESDWVLKEATILSWRVFQREPIVLVPVVLGVSVDDLSKRGFGALALNQVQSVRVTGTDDAAIARAVTEVVTALQRVPSSPLAVGERLPPTVRWIEAFADDLRIATATQSATLTTDYHVNMCRALDIRPQQTERFDADPCLNLAAQALLAGQDQIVRFLDEAGKPQRPLREQLCQAVAPLWVDPLPASRLASVGNVVAIDAEQVSTAREYIQRALCNRIASDHIIDPGDVNDGSDSEIIAAVERELDLYVDIGDPTAIADEIASRGPIFVVLGPGSVRQTVLDTLTARYPSLTIVTAAGEHPWKLLGSWWDPSRLLYPPLQRKREAAAARFRNKLQAFVNG